METDIKGETNRKKQRHGQKNKQRSTRKKTWRQI